MSSDFGFLNLFEPSLEPLMTDGEIASDSEAERDVVHIAHGEFENEDHVYDSLALSLANVTTSQCEDYEEIKEDDVMWSVTQDESLQEKSFLDPDSRDVSLDNICAAISDYVVEPISDNKQEKTLVEEKEDTSFTYCTIVCQVRILEYVTNKFGRSH
jgi:hypothetical protein